MADNTSIWIKDEAHIETMIQENPQDIRFDVMKSMKYDVILEMF